MPEELVPIIVISVMAFSGLSIFIIHTIFSFLRDKHGLDSKKGKDSSSLTTSELENMLRRVIEEATEPLMSRLENLEEQLLDGSEENERKGAEHRRRLSLPEPGFDEFDSDLDSDLDDGPSDLAALSKRQSSKSRQSRMS